jgi:serine/threonine protein kinase
MSISCPTCLTDNLDSAAHCTMCGSPLTELSYALPSGTTLQNNKYRIDKEIGVGGFGIVYKGINQKNSQTVAIKEIWPEKASRQRNTIVWSSSTTPQERHKQIQEVKNEAARLQLCCHRSIVKVYEFFEENQTAYIVMDFVEGKTLLKLLEEQGPLPETLIKRYFISVAEALKEVHDQQLIHRDIKPCNIIIDTQDVPVVIDFGAAREFITGMQKTHTQMVSDGYAPIEQYSLRAKRTPSMDLYALCASMYELLTGDLPASAIDRMVQDILIPPRQKNPQISYAMEQIILTGMKLRVEDRFQSAEDFIDAINGKSPLLKQARRLVNESKLLDAVQAYENCLNKDPDNKDAAVEVALVQIYIDDNQAEISAHRALQIKQDDGRVYGVLGLVKCHQKKWTEAVNLLQTASSLTVAEPWIFANLSWALGMLGKWQQAETVIDQALQINSKLTFALGVQSWIYAQQRKWKFSVRSAQMSIFISKQVNSTQDLHLQEWVYPCLLIALSKVVNSFHSPDLDRRIQDSVNQIPNNAFIWSFKGWKHAAQGFWNEAIVSLIESTSKKTKLRWAYQNLGVSYENINDVQKAIQVYEIAHQEYHNNSFYLFRLGTLLGKKGQWQKAYEILTVVVEQDPNHAEAYHNLGWVLLNLYKLSPQPLLLRQIFWAYSTAMRLYDQQKKYSLSQQLQTTFNFLNEVNGK